MKLLAFLVASLSLVPLAAAEVAVIIDDLQTLTIDCTEEPIVMITGNKATVTLTGTCAKVEITGNHAMISGSAKVVSIPGNHNTAKLHAVDVLSIPGNHNTATYKTTVQPKLKKPRIASPGNHNTITRTK